MKTVKLEVLGVSADYSVTENSAEMNALANVVKDGQLVDVAHDRAEQFTRFHQVNGDARAYIVEKITALKFTTPDGKLLAPKTVEAHRVRKDGTKVPYLKPDESEATFVKRAMALGAVDTAQLAAWLAEFAASPDAAWANYLKEITRHVAGPAQPTKRAIAKVAEWTAAGVLADKVKSLGERLGTAVDAADATAVAKAYDTFCRQYAAAAEEAAKRARAEAETAIG